ncbi:MAG: ATP synthase F1 subunit delta [Planctomycetes bacterium]|nr:ATP synthase F1 subunit delta [Planctomycetota bacterium]MBI3844743.1 ATP synthase F1 subunit delta [Planctomycetota bacterium]
MIASPLGRIYGTALFQLAQEKSVLPQVTEEFESFAAAWRAEPRLQAYLGSPNMLLEDKLALIEKCLGASASSLFRNFLGVLVDKARIDHLMEIHAAFRSLVDDMQGIVRGTARTAVPMGDGLVHDAEALLSKQLGKRITLDAITDPAILGGVVFKVQDRLIDASLRTQLGLLRDRLLSQGN